MLETKYPPVYLDREFSDEQHMAIRALVHAERAPRGTGPNSIVFSPGGSYRPSPVSTPARYYQHMPHLQKPKRKTTISIHRIHDR
ncbi:uncharacterized protein LOC124136738 isoform X2 [Haliotis rufescens]|uniref:uncharacterized protein LOC124136738 isoform X2 n=1 Tax=Haliotis rufescens TaxID=6454 RepID=UPI00201F7E25|nr:uncharacterized protein LOC124136738 isoform X2 [Haliotis rufescens]